MMDGGYVTGRTRQQSKEGTTWVGRAVKAPSPRLTPGGGIITSLIGTRLLE